MNGFQSLGIPSPDGVFPSSGTTGSFSSQSSCGVNLSRKGKYWSSTRGWCLRWQGPLSLLGNPGVALSRKTKDKNSLWAVQKGTWDQGKDGRYWVKLENCKKIKIWGTPLFFITLSFPRWNYKESLTVIPSDSNALQTFEGELWTACWPSCALWPRWMDLAWAWNSQAGWDA